MENIQLNRVAFNIMGIAYDDPFSLHHCYKTPSPFALDKIKARLPSVEGERKGLIHANGGEWE